jgi:hypothetical protein
MIRAFATAAIVAILLVPEQTEPGYSFAVPSGPLPWNLPIWPTVDIAIDEPVLTITGPTHSADYTTIDTNIDDWLTAMTTPISDLTTTVDSWWGAAGIMPDMSTSDFDTGIDPVGTGNMTISDYTTEIGANIGTAFSYIRVLGFFDIGSSAAFVTFVLIDISWFALIYLLRFGYQMLDTVFSWVSKLIELLPIVE